MSHYSKTIPDYLVRGLEEKESARVAKAKVLGEKAYADKKATGRLTVADLQNEEFIDHGLGVLEASSDGSIWYKEGNQIVRQDDEDFELVLRAMSEGNNKKVAKAKKPVLATIKKEAARDYINIGSTPPEEDCASVGSDNYYSRAKEECIRYIDVIRKKLGKEPFGARLTVKSFPHDFGTYLEVVCYYDDENEEATNYAFLCESDGPQTWDDITPVERKQTPQSGEEES